MLKEAFFVPIMIIGLGLLFYLTFGLFLYLNQELKLFRPSPDEDFKACHSFPDSVKKMDDEGTRFFIEERNKRRKSAIVFFHGNAHSSCAFPNFYHFFDDINKSIIMSVYPGYAGDDNTPKVLAVKKYTHELFEYLFSKGYKSENITVVGYSLGTAFASYASQEFNISNVVLLAPMSSVLDMAKRSFPLYPIDIMLKEHLDLGEMLSWNAKNVLIFHGSNDPTVPARLSEKLQNTLAKKNIEVNRVLLENEDHGSIFYNESLKEGIIDFVKKR